MVLIVLARSAHADPFVEVLGGLLAPVGDDSWKANVAACPELAGRLGLRMGSVGLALSLEGTDIRGRDQSLGYTGERVRLLANV